MKYTIDIKTLSGFIQCITQPGKGDNMGAPHIMQVRDSQRILLRLHRALKLAFDAVAHQEEHYHTEGAAQQAFDNGACFFEPGDIPVTVVLHRRQVNVFIGAQVAFKHVHDLRQLIAKVAAAEEVQRKQG